MVLINRKYPQLTDSSIATLKTYSFHCKKNNDNHLEVRIMNETLKITNTLSDPTRYYIYQYVLKKHFPVTVKEIAKEFSIHPNVARLHLSKLAEINMLEAKIEKTGQGGRPSKRYHLTDSEIGLHFPYRNYQMLSDILLETMITLGPEGKKALYVTGKKYGEKLMETALHRQMVTKEDSFERKLALVIEAAEVAGLQPEFKFDGKKIMFEMFNCPFKETAKKNQGEVCQMHFEFLRGMFETVFLDIELRELGNMLNGCVSCSYEAVAK
ncbi:helix-turn-helix transcriptional regulator [Cytobacillus stercorigallinarum]|nr:helix-turn-helix domain-containing protein [Cytobacillus stercorigallinarum]